MDYAPCQPTVRMPQERYVAHMKLYNRYASLRLDDSMDEVEESDLRLVHTASESCHRVTAGEIDQLLLTRVHNGKQNRRKARNTIVQKAEKLTSESSVRVVITAKQVLERTRLRKGNAKPYGTFTIQIDTANSLALSIQCKKKAYDLSASSERRFISDENNGKRMPKSQLTMGIGTGGTVKFFSKIPMETELQKTRLIMCIGTSGTRLGSRITGHGRRGGK